MSYRWFLYPKSILVLIMLASTVFCREAYGSSLHLNWTDVSTNETGFKIERMVGSASYGQIATVASNIQTYNDTTVTAGSTYCYRVRAFNSAGNSAYSNAGCATVPTTTTSTPPSSTGSSTGSTATSGTIAQLSSKWNDYRVTMKIQSPDNDRVGVMFRYHDNENYYRFWLSGGSRRLEKQVGGVLKVLAQDTAGYTARQIYTVQIVAQGSALKVLIDGKTIFSVTDSSFSDGTIALYSYYNVGSLFDDVLVEELPSGTVLLSDNFNDRDHVGWTIVDEGDQGGPSSWSAATGAFVQSSNISGTYALFTRGSWQDYRVTLKMRSVDNDGIGVMFRFQDRDNYYRFLSGQGSVGHRLIKREKGADKIIVQDTVPYVAGKNYQVEIIAQGNSLKVNLDGKAVFSVTDESFKTGTIGLYSYWNKGSAFDDVLVEELPTKAVLLWDDFNNGNFTGWNVFDNPGADSQASAWSVVKGELLQNSNIPETFVLY